LLLNRFVASPGHSDAYGTQYYFPKTRFYYLKDRLMNRFGKVKGLTLQEWTSWASYDPYDNDGCSDGAIHEHILERVKIGRAVLHRPTGHFYFCNTLNGYSKCSVGFSEAKAKCTETITGKKAVKVNYPDAITAWFALRKLEQRHARLLAKSRPMKPMPRIVTGDYYDCDYEPRRHPVVSPTIATVRQCHWCNQDKPIQSTVGEHPFCADCLPMAKMAPVTGAIESEVPF